MKVAALAALVVLVALLAVAASVQGKEYFKETFDDAAWKDRWVYSDNKKAEGSAGEFKWTAGQWFGSKNNKGIQTPTDARFYTISSKFAEPFTNVGKDLVLQFSVKHEQDLDCGGAYIKVLPVGTDQKAFNGDTRYNLMFGPDICGYATRKIHNILNYKGENHLWKKEPRCETDKLTHVYTLRIKPDNTYEVYVDLEKKESGSLEDDWDMLKPKEIKDPSASKPADWVDDKEIDDPEDKKPEGYDDIPEKIVDPEAKRPEDWNDEEDGTWTAPLITNPEYKGPWKPRRIPNPAYKGPWVHPMIPNPDFQPDDELYVQRDMGLVGIEIWQVKSGSLFDSIIVTDSLEEAKAFAQETWAQDKDGEKASFERIDKERKEKEEAERKQREEEAKKAAEEKAKKEYDEKQKKGGDEADEDSDEGDEDVAADGSNTGSAAGDSSKASAEAKKKARRAKLNQMKKNKKEEL